MAIKNGIVYYDGKTYPSFHEALLALWPKKDGEK